MQRSWPLVLICLTGCGSGTAPDSDASDIRLELVGLRALDPATEGSYEAWAVLTDGSRRSAGRFEPSSTTQHVNSPVGDPAGFSITVEPPGDDDEQPSANDLLVGQFEGGIARLSIVRAVTGVDVLEEHPGHHALFTPSDNPDLGFPSYEDSGLWVFAPVKSETKYNNHFLRLTPLRAGWIYEGWIVHGYGTPDECWLSYGKFLPDGFRSVNTRDDTGLGVFSGQIDYVEALPYDVDMPGDDWVANIHGLPTPCGLSLPFDLNGDADRGIASPWTHVITIEPRFDTGEDPMTERPFLMQPYRNAIGEGPPNSGREVLYYPVEIPSGTATIVPAWETA